MDAVDAVVAVVAVEAVEAVVVDSVVAAEVVVRLLNHREWIQPLFFQN